MPSISTVQYIGTVTVVARNDYPAYTYITNNTTNTILAISGSWSANIAAGQTSSMRGVDIVHIMVPGGSSITVPPLDYQLNKEFKYKMFA